MATVSVIIPTYNHVDYVAETLETVFAQTFGDYEVIVVNDGSPDGTAEVLRPSREAGRIRYIEQANAGQAAARNRGLAEARGEFIAFLDDDDLWPPDKLQWQVDVLRSEPDLDVVGGTAVVIDETGKVEAKTNIVGEITPEAVCRRCPMLSPGQSLIRRSALDKCGGFATEIWGADDWDLWLRLSTTGRISMRDRMSLTHRFHTRSASKNIHRMLKNTVAVIDRNLPRSAGRRVRHLRREAFRYQYRYSGRWISDRVRAAIGRLELRQALNEAASLKPFCRAALGDPRLMFWLIRGFLPEAIGSRISRS